MSSPTSSNMAWRLAASGQGKQCGTQTCRTARPAKSERALCARSAGAGRRYQFLFDVGGVGGTSRPAATARQRASRQTRWHLQQRRLRASGRDTDGRSPFVTGHHAPLVCIHPDTGRPGLCLGRRRNAYIEGLSLDESEALLDEVWAEATRTTLTGRTSGALATWCCGTTDPPCIGAMRLIRRRAG